MSAPTALRQSVASIRVRGGLTFMQRQRLRDAGAAVFADGEDEMVVGVSVATFERLTGIKVLETVV